MPLYFEVIYCALITILVFLSIEYIMAELTRDSAYDMVFYTVSSLGISVSLYWVLDDEKSRLMHDARRK